MNVYEGGKCGKIHDKDFDLLKEIREAEEKGLKHLGTIFGSRKDLKNLRRDQRFRDAFKK